MELYPIGTIIEIAKIKYIILGYQQQVHNNAFLNGYIVAQYPIGFTEMKDLKVVKPKNIDKVVQEGFKESDLYHEYASRKARFFEKTKDMNPEEIEKGLGILVENIKREAEVNE